MALQDASVHKATADSRSVTITLDSESMEACETAVAACALNAKCQRDGKYLAEVQLNFSGDNIIQSDDSTISIIGFIAALKSQNYEVAHFPKYDKLFIHLRF